jgi:RNA-directed DNA polymerase
MKADEAVQPPAESKSSARAHMPHARKPGDLGVGPSQAGHPREGRKPHAAGGGPEESDALIVPTWKKSAKTRVTPVESMEGRGAAKGKPVAAMASSTQREESVHAFLRRVGERARAHKEERFNNLFSRLTVPLLREAYGLLEPRAASGVDGMTWKGYGEGLEERLADLEERLHRGRYEPPPVRRVYIPKGDGKMRPLGVPALEDKIVQQAARMLLEPVYEASFLGFSYGFRPGRSQHDALDALAVFVERGTNWVLDADIRAFFDTIDHAWMRRFLDHRISDPRMLKLLEQWLKAGVLEDGEFRTVTEGTPQGGIISPLLANIYLHYVLDLWIHRWRRRYARGKVSYVRYADDFVVGLEREQEAHALKAALAERLAQFALELHPEKTRVLRFGPRAQRARLAADLGKPETFVFLGFTHICANDRAGRFQLRRRTSRKKRQAKLKNLREEIRRRRHRPLREQHRWLVQVLRGHYGYYGVPTNIDALRSYRRDVQYAWHQALQRRSQRARWSEWERREFDLRWPLPKPTIGHPWPSARFRQRRSHAAHR